MFSRTLPVRVYKDQSLPRHPPMVFASRPWTGRPVVVYDDHGLRDGARACQRPYLYRPAEALTSAAFRRCCGQPRPKGPFLRANAVNGSQNSERDAAHLTQARKDVGERSTRSAKGWTLASSQ